MKAQQVDRKRQFSAIFCGLVSIASFSCSSNQKLAKDPAIATADDIHACQFDTTTLKTSIETHSHAVAQESRLTTLYGLDSIFTDDEAVNRLLQLARQHYSNALRLESGRASAPASAGQDSSAVEFESAISILNDLSYYPDIENDSDFVGLSNKIIGDYEKYISTVQNLGPGTSVFALKEKLSEVVDTINVSGTKFPKPETTKTTVPLVLNKFVEQNIEFLSTRGRWHMQNWIYRSGTYVPMMKKIFKEEGVPEELVYMSMPESGLNPKARSWARAVGLWQFTRGTGALYGLHSNWWYDERRDPLKSTRAAAAYLRYLYDHYEDWYLVLASYDCGSVERAIRRSHGKRDFWEIKKHLPREARNYVPQYIATALIAMNPKAYGFDNKVPAVMQTICDTITIPESVDLRVLADEVGIDIDSLLDLNPELVHSMTPPNFDGDGYPLRVPAGMGPLFAQNYQKLPESAKLTWTFHTVRRGESLYGIARRYRVRLTSLRLSNDLSRRTRRLRPGTVLMIPVESSYYARSKSQNGRSVVSQGELTRNDDPDSPIHIVEKGETLSSIAEDHNTTVANLKRLNNLRNSFIKPKMKLYMSASIPNTKTTVSPKVKPPSPSIAYHKVKRNESLIKIAALYGVKISDLKNWNRLSSSRLMVGQRLKIMKPSPASTESRGMFAGSAPQEARTTYRVRHGDSLWSIAKKFGITIAQIREWNETADADIRPGQRIVIYN
jgi:membrane-bound lytic murein transglycosylase D